LWRSGSRAGDEILSRGSLVFAHFRGINVRRGREGRRQDYNTVGQIVALPADRIEIKEGRFIVNGRTLDENKFPVPGWLSRVRLSATIPSDSYFVCTAYRMSGASPPLSVIIDACILPDSDIEALVVMRWFPLTRRGFLRPYE
jgi:hypothetical protein